MFKKIAKASLGAFIVLLAMSLFLYANGAYPFGDKTISWCDMNQQVVPLLLQFKDILAGKEGFFLSVKNACGMNFFGVFFFFLSSPFSFLVSFVEKADMLSFMNVLVALKMSACAFTASLWLSSRKVEKFPVNCALSVLYAFSGYTMMYYQNVIWLDMAYLFPLLLWSLERLKQGKKLFFTLTLAACMIVNYYIGYMIVVFILLYVFVYLLLNGKSAQGFAFDFGLSCFMAATLSAVVWLPSLLQYFSSGRTSDIIQNLRYSYLSTPVETAYPTIFSILFLLPFALLDRNHDKERTLLKLLLLLTLLPIFLEPINKMWQTGSYMSFPTRYAFMTILLCITLAHDNISAYVLPMPLTNRKSKPVYKEKIASGKETPAPLSAPTIKKKGNLIPWIFGSVALLLTVAFTIFAVHFTKEHSKDMGYYAQTLWGNQTSLALLFTVYGAAMLIGFLWFILRSLHATKRFLLWTGITAMVVCELYIAPTVYMLTPMNDTGNYRQTADMGGMLKDDRTFFRVKTTQEYSYYNFHANMMGGLGYNAIGHYTSLTDTDYMTAIKQFGYTSYWMEVGNSGGSILSDALLSVKYAISTAHRENEIYHNDYYHLFETENYLPLGIVTKADIIQTRSSGGLAMRGELQQQLYKDFFGTSDGVTLCSLSDAKTNGVTIEYKDDGKILLTPQWENAQITFHLPIRSPSVVYFNVFDENTNALVQGVNEKFKISSIYRTYYNFPTQKNNGFADMGTFRFDTDIAVSLSQPVTVSDMSVFAIAQERLQQDISTTKTVNLQTNKNGFHGNYTADQKECIFLSVPYNKGFTLKINGKTAPLYSVYNGFTAFYTEVGQNEIEISFAPPGFTLGLACSIFGILLTSTVIFFTERKHFTLTNKKVLTVSYFLFVIAGAFVFFLVYLLPMGLCLL